MPRGLVWERAERDVDEESKWPNARKRNGKGTNRLRTIDWYAAIDVSYALTDISLRRWRRPQDKRVAVAIVAARAALDELVEAMRVHRNAEGR